MSENDNGHAVLVGGPADGYCLGYAVDALQISYPVPKPMLESIFDQIRRLYECDSVEEFVRSEKPSVDIATYRKRGSTQYFDFVEMTIL